MAEAPQKLAALTVLIGTDTFAPDVNGAARFTERLAAGLVARGHIVHIAAPSASRRDGTFTEVHDGQPMTVHRIPSWRWLPHDWLRFVLPFRINHYARPIIETVRPDVVHIQSAVIVGRGLAKYAAARNIPIIATNHLMPENMVEHSLLPGFARAWFFRTYWRYVMPTFNRARAVTTPTRRAAEFLEEFSGLTGVHAISCGIDASNYRPDFSPRLSKQVLFVGRLTAEKHIDVLLRAMAALPKELDARLEIIGDGDLRRQLEHLTAQLGLTSAVTFAGYVSDEYLRDAYSAASVFVMPGIAELQSIATMEALASGLPVVAANAMALPHLVRDGVNGYLFEPGSAVSLSERLGAILSMGDEARELFGRASLGVIQAHDIQRTLSAFEAMYRGETVVDPITEDASEPES